MNQRFTSGSAFDDLRKRWILDLDDHVLRRLADASVRFAFVGVLFLANFLLTL
jgi:hypothetical protein